MNLWFSIGVLICTIGIAQMSSAQVMSSLWTGGAPSSADKTKVAQQHADTTNIQHCQAAATQAAQRSAHGSHTVTLSWQASMPAKDDPVKCYVVYRGANSFDEKAIPIGVTYAPETTFVDRHVAPGSYSYAIKAVSVHELESKFSEVLPVQVR